MRLHVSYEFPFFTRARIHNARKQNGRPEFACVYLFCTNISYVRVHSLENDSYTCVSSIE